MYSIKNIIHKEITEEHIELIKKHQKDILFYLTELNERKTGYLYYPIFNFRNRTLVTVNVKNNDNKYNLIKPLNEKIIVKITIIKNHEIWEAINTLLRIFSCTVTDNEEYLYNDVRVFKIYDIIAYLRKIKFDLTGTELVCNVFKSIYLRNNQDDKKNKLVCYIERDVTIIMILKNINRFYKTSQKTNKTQCIRSVDVTDDMIDDTIVLRKISLEDNEYNMYFEPKVHLVHRKLYDRIKDDIVSYQIHFVKNNQYNNYTYFSKLVYPEYTLISGYPNFKIFPKGEKE